MVTFKDGRRPILIPSAAHKKWHKEAMLELTRQLAPKDKIEKCQVHIHIFFPDRRKADITNKVESLMDVLVDYGVILDDAWQIVPKLVLTAEYNKEYPGANIHIIEEGEVEQEEMLMRR